MSEFLQTTISLKARPRGFHLITREVVQALPQLDRFSAGLLHVFIQHTSAGLTINENADPDVRVDMETAANRLCPESSPFIHTCEGPDDMPAPRQGFAIRVKCHGPNQGRSVSSGHLARDISLRTSRSRRRQAARADNQWTTQVKWSSVRHCDNSTRWLTVQFTS